MVEMGAKHFTCTILCKNSQIHSHTVIQLAVLTKRFIHVLRWLLPLNEFMYVRASKANPATNHD